MQRQVVAGQDYGPVSLDALDPISLSWNQVNKQQFASGAGRTVYRRSGTLHILMCSPKYGMF